MFRRVAVVAVLVALTVSACGPGPGQSLSPTEILNQSIATLSALKSVHVHVDVAGSAKLDILNIGIASSIDLTGTTADIDVDSVNHKLHATVTIPTLLGATADLIQIGPDQYLKTSISGPKYRKTTAAPIDAGALIKALQDVVAKLPAPPVRGADEKIGDQLCYRLTLKMTAADIRGLGAPLPPAMSGDGTIDLWVRMNDSRPAKALVALSGGDQGSLTLTILPSNFDVPVAIDPPPVDQVAT
jgi:LppX_LprAFG lipoprotein